MNASAFPPQLAPTANAFARAIADPEDDIAALTRMRIGHSTQQSLAGHQLFECAEVKQDVSESGIDGDKVRLRDLVDTDSPWRVCGGKIPWK